MNEKALIYLIFFIMSIPLNRLSCRWLWNSVCESAGKTPIDIMEHRAELRRSFNPHRKLSAWLISDSEDPQKTRKLYTIYQLCTVPCVICVIFSIIGFFTHFLDKFLDYSAFAMIGFIMIAAIFGTKYNGSKK